MLADDDACLLALSKVFVCVFVAVVIVVVFYFHETRDKSWWNFY
jgi:hypothetical protein